MHSARAAIAGGMAILLASCAASGGGSVAPGAARVPFVGEPTLRIGDTFTREIRPYEILNPQGEAYAFPFLGGFDVPRPQFADVDGDGDADLFVQERTDELIHFENVGTAAEPRFEWRTDTYQNLPVGEWARFHDLDDDGDLDLLAETRFSYVQYFRNDGTPTAPRFTFIADSIPEASGEPLFSDRQNIPYITDIDCDGHPDLFLGRIDGTVQRWERLRLDEEGVPVFVLRAARFEDIEIVAAISVPGGVQPRSNTPGGRPDAIRRRGGGGAFDTLTARPTLHGANSMSFADFDLDGDADLFWGDFFEAGLLWIENRGTCGNPDFRAEPEAAPATDTILTSGYNASALHDLDGDGDPDLLMGVLGGAFNPNRTSADNLHYYESVDGQLIERATRFLDGVDIGSESVPAFGDLDGDGDLDLLVGNKLDPTEVRMGKLYHLENVGAPGAPRYAMRDTIEVGELFHLAPELHDLDGDGDLDLLMGTWNDDVVVFENAGSPSAPDFRPAGDAPLVELTRGSHAVPELGDLDGDGVLDLLVGESSGEVNWYRGIAGGDGPTFELVTDAIGDLDAGRRSHPVLIDVDGDGDLDLVVGREEAGAALWRNDGTPTEPRFVDAGDLPVPLPRFSSPVFQDLDRDGDLDVVSGGMSGGLVFLRNDGGPGR